MPFFVTLASLTPCPWGAKHRLTLPFQMLTDLNTYLNKAIPDTRLTIKKYLDVKFEYLVSVCSFWGGMVGPGGVRAHLEIGPACVRWQAGLGWNLSHLIEDVGPGPGKVLGKWVAA